MTVINIASFLFDMWQKYDFPLYENQWTAEDEIKLLESVENFGYGNW